MKSSSFKVIDINTIFFYHLMTCWEAGRVIITTAKVLLTPRLREDLLNSIWSTMITRPRKMVRFKPVQERKMCFRHRGKYSLLSREFTVKVI